MVNPPLESSCRKPCAFQVKCALFKFSMLKGRKNISRRQPSNITSLRSELKFFHHSNFLMPLFLNYVGKSSEFLFVHQFFFKSQCQQHFYHFLSTYTSLSITFKGRFQLKTTRLIISIIYIDNKTNHFFSINIFSC